MRTGWSAYFSRLTPGASWAPLAVLAVSANVQAQFLSATTTPDEQHYVDLIEQRQDSEGRTAPALVEPLTALGLQYYQRKQFDLAVEAFGQARQITRINHGLDSLQEMPLLEQLIRIEEARRDPVAAWRYEQTLLQVAQKNIDDLAAVPVFRDAAQRRLTLRQQYLDGAHPPQIELGCYYGWSLHLSTLRVRGVLTDATPPIYRNCNAGERDTVNAALLLEARHYQLLAIAALLQNDGYASQEMWGALTDMLWTSELVHRKLPLFQDQPLQAMMTRLLAYQVTDTPSTIRRAQILLLAADMRVMGARQADDYAGFDEVLEGYAVAYDLLRKGGVNPATLSETFSPSVPVVLPSYLPNPLATSADTEAVGYIDASFEITARGKSKHITIDAISAGVNSSAQRALKRLIERSTFRPPVVEGKVATSIPVVLRYYLDDGAGGLDLSTSAVTTTINEISATR